MSTYLVPTLLPHLLTSLEHRCNNSLKLLREAKGQRNFESEENYNYTPLECAAKQAQHLAIPSPNLTDFYFLGKGQAPPPYKYLLS